MSQFDVIVVGGGTSGMMAAVQAALNGVRVALVEKNTKLGRKLILTGGGRCNVTNNSSRDELIKHIPGNGKFLYSALDQFDQSDIMAFFQDRGVELKEEDHGRMFPVTDSARTIRDTLINELKVLEVTIFTNQAVDSLLFDHDNQKVSGVQIKDGRKLFSKKIILAVGGKAYPRTGSEGDGYQWAQDAGHTLTDFYATEAPLLSNDDFIQAKTLQGISLRDVAVTLWDSQTASKQPIVTHQMDMIFTHFGYSGPAVLRCSGHVNLLLKENQAPLAHLTIDMTPHLSIQDLKDSAESMREKQLSTILNQWLPERLTEVVINRLALDSKIPYKQLVHSQVDQLWQLIKSFPITSYGSQPIAKGFVTGGGVNTKEVMPQTMESKLISGLYFCGELLDVNGYTGGYNITAAFSTGAVSGQHAAWSSFT